MSLWHIRRIGRADRGSPFARLERQFAGLHGLAFADVEGLDGRERGSLLLLMRRTYLPSGMPVRVKAPWESVVPLAMGLCMNSPSGPRVTSALAAALSSAVTTVPVMLPAGAVCGVVAPVAVVTTIRIIENGPIGTGRACAASFVFPGNQCDSQYRRRRSGTSYRPTALLLAGQSRSRWADLSVWKGGREKGSLSRGGSSHLSLLRHRGGRGLSRWLGRGRRHRPRHGQLSRRVQRLFRLPPA